MKEGKTAEEFNEEIKLLNSRIEGFEKLIGAFSQQDSLRLAAVMRDANDSIIIQDTDGRITAWNRGAELMYGYSQKEALGMNIERLTVPEKIEEHKQITRSLITGETVTSFETQRVTKSGRVIDVWLTVTKLEEIPTDSIISTGRDITQSISFALIERNISERKQAENELRTSKQIIEGIINSIPVRVFWKDKNLVYLGCNAIFAADAGFADPKDIVGKNDYQLGWKDQAEAYRKDDLQVISSGLPKLLIEEPQTTPNGEAITLLTNKLPLRDSHGEIIGMIGTYMDITERKEAEDALQRAYKELKQTQAQLIQSGKMSALGQLAGGVAHELNNPLTGVLNNIQLIKMEIEARKEFKPGDFKELIGIIESSALRCKSITQSLLDFSHASKGKVNPVSLNELADKTIDLILLELKLQGISFNRELQPDLPLIMGDFQLLQQVVFGLINNAQWAIRKKSKEGGVITVKTWYDPQEKAGFLSVADTGIGISEENMKKLFTPFFTTKDVGEGTGIGLALFYTIVKSMGGDIKAESQAGIGSTFTITIPH